MGAEPAGAPLLEVKDLRTHFFTDDGVVKAVDDVTFTIGKGQVLGVVGESGCGKSVTALSILRLISPPGRIVSGRILFEGRDLVKLPEAEMRSIRGNNISMIFQEPMTSLNPVFTVGNQIGEAIMLHQKKTKREARDRSVAMLERVKVPAASQRVDEYPHQLSGGMRQRVMIAMALACHPKLLIADEPTTALDVTIQAQILDLLRELQQEFHMSVMIITHDLGVVAEFSDQVAVMYASKIVEYTTAKELYANPIHPYTKGLFRSRPSTLSDKKEALKVIPGTVPNPLHFPSGCKFHPRCDLAASSGKLEQCKVKEPELREIVPGHFVACDVV
jgi:peptide/nickel transport system ATP-binding protein/oligopeptide transport system ATP-binding protein